MMSDLNFWILFWFQWPCNCKSKYSNNEQYIMNVVMLSTIDIKSNKTFGVRWIGTVMQSYDQHTRKFQREMAVIYNWLLFSNVKCPQWRYTVFDWITSCCCLGNFTCLYRYEITFYVITMCLLFTLCTISHWLTNWIFNALTISCDRLHPIAI